MEPWLLPADKPTATLRPVAHVSFLYVQSSSTCMILISCKPFTDSATNIHVQGSKAAGHTRSSPFPYLRVVTMVFHQYSRHPLRALYLTFELTVTLFFRLPSWVLWNLPKASRPRPSWSLTKSVLIKMVDHINVVEGRWVKTSYSFPCGKLSASLYLGPTDYCSSVII